MEILHTAIDISQKLGGTSVAIKSIVQTLSENTNHSITLGTWNNNNNGTGDSFLGRVDLNAKILKKFDNCELIHDHGIWLPTNHQLAKFSNEHKIPRIISPHGMLEPWALKYKYIKKKLAWQLYQKKDLATAKVIHATSDQETENIKRLGLEVPIATIPLGINVPVNLPIRQKNTKKTLLYLSRIQKKKGLDLLIDAWDNIKNDDWQIIIAGPDEDNYSELLMKKINNKGLKKYFHFVGPVWGEDKWKLMRSADIFILPTNSENFGLVIGEALACGIPVITTKGAPWEDLVTYGCGWWINVASNAIEDAINEAFLLTPNQLEAMGQRGQELIRTKYSWKIVGEKLLDLYEWLLDINNKKPDFVN